MLVKTTRFGEVEIADGKIIRFNEGIPGLEQLKRFALISLEDTEPFHWFQAIDDPDISLPIINPFQIIPNYTPEVSETVFEELQIENEEDVLILTVAVIPSEAQRMTTNLSAPILINAARNLGKQVILEKGDYELRYPIFEAIKRFAETLEAGGAENAGTDKEA